MLFSYHHTSRVRAARLVRPARLMVLLVQSMYIADSRNCEGLPLG